MADIPDTSSDALEDIAYLARSENRVRVLETLTESVTQPGRSAPGYSRRELTDTTETSRTTLGRILTEFQERDWARRNSEGEYVVTPLGQHIAAAFTPVVEAMQTLQSLGDAAALIPPSALVRTDADVPAVSIRDFREATIREPDKYDPTFFGRSFAEMLEGAGVVRSIVYVATPQNMLTAFEEELERGDLQVRAAFSESVAEHILETPDVGPRPEHAAHERVDMFRYDGHIPCNLFVIDETVLIENSQVESVPDGTLIETDNAPVRAWAEGLIEHYIDESKPIAASDFS